MVDRAAEKQKMASRLIESRLIEYPRCGRRAHGR